MNPRNDCLGQAKTTYRQSAAVDFSNHAESWEESMITSTQSQIMGGTQSESNFIGKLTRVWFFQINFPRPEYMNQSGM